ncbi:MULTISPECIES: hypothetical protein [Bacillus]|uniref:hypothetical protein n=1 Tax=Bacillus TaxID=1386 RepID=UPI000AEE0FEC|nr:hypothetical protein [Bacillus sp. UNC322MFChir4.1]
MGAKCGKIVRGETRKSFAEYGYLDGYLTCGEASNGMKFIGYFRDEEITNFQPVISFD